MYEFIDLEIPIPKLQKMFSDAIERCNQTSYIEDINGYYYNNEGISTPEYEALVSKVKDVNAALYNSISLKSFEAIVRDLKSSEKLNSYRGLASNIFQNVSANEFFNLFLQYNNSRKREYWNFFEARYKFRECYFVERDFILELKAILKEYITCPDTPITGTRKYCCKLLELLEKKSQLYESAPMNVGKA